MKLKFLLSKEDAAYKGEGPFPTDAYVSETGLFVRVFRDGTGFLKGHVEVNDNMNNPRGWRGEGTEVRDAIVALSDLAKMDKARS